ncbi:MAG TPA: ABC transporter substrate-binding protein [Anaerolineales bacterium]|nr:ABC transporter substrate-binding protein [Anaerolineales bacterium]
MENKRKFTRREFLKIGAFTAAGALAACSPATLPATPEPTAPSKPLPTATSAPTGPTYSEPSMLADLVEQGKLPPVVERLPENPWVAPVLESNGKSGGVIRRAFTGPGDKWGMSKLGDRALVWFDQNLVMQPRMCESWEVNDDGTEWTFHLRKGTKWSDGTEHTSADVVWWYEHEATNETLFPGLTEGRWFTGTGETKKMMEVIAPDDYTFTFKYAEPKPLLIYTMGRQGVAAPAHYMKQWIPDTADDPDKLAADVEAAGFESWDKYYIDNRRFWMWNPDLPHFGPWVAKNDLNAEKWVIERNPYFFGVDSDGMQLPYLDGVHSRLFSDAQVFNLWLTNGEIDFQARRVQVGDYTLLKENEAAGDYEVVPCPSAKHMVVVLNQASKNEQLRNFFMNRDVRIALSLAINRKGINELNYLGLGTPRQYSPLSMSPQYHEKLSNAYIEYNPRKANELLDAAGYTAKDEEGFRKYSEDGETIFFVLEGQSGTGTPDEDAAQQIVKMFKAVGVKCEYKFVETTLYNQHYTSNDLDAAWWYADRTVVPLGAEGLIFRGIASDRPFVDAYNKFFDDPENPIAIEPPPDHYIRKIRDLWEQVLVTGNPDKQNELFAQILDIWAEELPMIGVVGELPALTVVKNGLKNFGPSPNDDTTCDEYVLNPETLFWENPAEHMLEA